MIVGLEIILAHHLVGPGIELDQLVCLGGPGYCF